jgi:hypothetical protein
MCRFDIQEIQLVDGWCFGGYFTVLQVRVGFGVCLATLGLAEGWHVEGAPRPHQNFLE